MTKIARRIAPVMARAIARTAAIYRHAGTGWPALTLWTGTTADSLAEERLVSLSGSGYGIQIFFLVASRQDNARRPLSGTQAPASRGRATLVVARIAGIWRSRIRFGLAACRVNPTRFLWRNMPARITAGTTIVVWLLRRINYYTAAPRQPRHSNSCRNGHLSIFFPSYHL